MTVDWAVVATSAAPQTDGALAVLGAGSHTFISIPRTSLPEQFQKNMAPGAIGTPVQVCVVARLNANRSEAQQPHKIEVRVVDADGKVVITNVSTVAINNDPNLPVGWPLLANVIMNFGIGVYPNYGEYAIDIVIDGDTKKTLRFRILPAPGVNIHPSA